MLLHNAAKNELNMYFSIFDCFSLCSLLLKLWPPSLLLPFTMLIIQAWQTSISSTPVSTSKFVNLCAGFVWNRKEYITCYLLNTQFSKIDIVWTQILYILIVQIKVNYIFLYFARGVFPDFFWSWKSELHTCLWE